MARDRCFPSRPCKRALLVVLAATVTLPLATAPVNAQPIATEVALADALYRQGRELMSQGQFEQACPKLAESYRLDRATGTLLNLAACHERLGKLATSWLEYTDAAEAARRDGRPDRVSYAQERIRALETQLSRVTLAASPESDDAELEVRLDGALIGAAARGVPTPVDPGRHTVEAKAPGKITWHHDLDIAQTSEQLIITIPKLIPVTPEITSAAPLSTEQTTALRRPPALAPSERAIASSRPTPVAVYVLGATSVALGTAAVITGVLYLNQRSAYRRADASDSDVASAHDAARTLGWVNVALWAGTAIAAGATGYLYVARPASSAGGALQVVPLAGPGIAGLSVTGEL